MNNCVTCDHHDIDAESYCYMFLTIPENVETCAQHTAKQPKPIIFFSREMMKKYTE